jgi:Uncharacterized protein conserved in bacteria
MPKEPKLSIEDLPEFYPRNRQEWRAWLEENHATAPGVWVIYYKKSSGMPSLSWSEVVDEILCFGWIDSKQQSLDTQRYRQLITPRKPKSVWSRINKAKIEELIASGRMTAAGLAKIEAAKADGSWTALDAVEALTVAPDLEVALAANETARANFEAFPRSARRNYLFWIESAKRPETRQKRVEEVVRLAAQNRKTRL